MGGEDPQVSPDFDPIREALGRLCTQGLTPWWVHDKAEVLLRLQCVVARCPARDGRGDEADGESDSEVEALREVLRELVSRISGHSHGQILWTVMDLGGEHPGTSVKQRREIVGKDFRKGEKPVSANTIRQYHEKKALDRLTEMLVDEERRHISGAARRP